MNHFKVLIWNSNGISCKAREIELFAHNNSVDILLLNEIRLNRGETVKIYSAYKPSRNNHGVGGAAVLVKSISIFHKG